MTIQELNEEVRCDISGVIFSGFWRRFAAIILYYILIAFFILMLGNILNFVGFSLAEEGEIFMNLLINIV